MSEQDQWKHRVKMEFEEVHGRVKRLQAFLRGDASVTEAETQRLLEQLTVMIHYREILRERIAANFQ